MNKKVETHEEKTSLVEFAQNVKMLSSSVESLVVSANALSLLVKSLDKKIDRVENELLTKIDLLEVRLSDKIDEDINALAATTSKGFTRLESYIVSMEKRYATKDDLGRLALQIG